MSKSDFGVVQIKTGDLVTFQFRGQSFPGIIVTDYGDGSYEIVDERNTSSCRVKRDYVQLRENIKVGDEVEFQFRGQVFMGIVTRDNGDGSYDIADKSDPGESSCRIKRNCIFLRSRDISIEDPQNYLRPGSPDRVKIPPEHTKPIPVGSSVRVSTSSNTPASDSWSSGVVTRARLNGDVDVEYADQSTEIKVSRDRLQVIKLEVEKKPTLFFSESSRLNRSLDINSVLTNVVRPGNTSRQGKIFSILSPDEKSLYASCPGYMWGDLYRLNTTMVQRYYHRDVRLWSKTARHINLYDGAIEDRLEEFITKLLLNLGISKSFADILRPLVPARSASFLLWQLSEILFQFILDDKDAQVTTDLSIAHIYARLDYVLRIPETHLKKIQREENELSKQMGISSKMFTQDIFLHTDKHAFDSTDKTHRWNWSYIDIIEESDNSTNATKLKRIDVHWDDGVHSIPFSWVPTSTHSSSSHGHKKSLWSHYTSVENTAPVIDRGILAGSISSEFMNDLYDEILKSNQLSSLENGDSMNFADDKMESTDSDRADTIDDLHNNNGVELISVVISEALRWHVGSNLISLSNPTALLSREDHVLPFESVVAASLPFLLPSSEVMINPSYYVGKDKIQGDKIRCVNAGYELYFHTANSISDARKWNSVICCCINNFRDLNPEMAAEMNLIISDVSPKTLINSTALTSKPFSVGIIGTANISPLIKDNSRKCCQKHFEMNSVVEVFYRDSIKWSRAKISSCNDNGHYDVVYDDGQKEKNVPPRIIRTLISQSLASLPEIFTGHKGAVIAMISVDIDGASYLISGGEDFLMIIWNFATGEKVRQIGTERRIQANRSEYENGLELGHTSNVMALASLSVANETFIISASIDKTVKIWKFDSAKDGSAINFELKNTVKSNAGIVAMTILKSSGYHFILTGHQDSSLIVWPFELEKEPIKIHAFTGHTGQVRTIAATLDSSYIVSGSNDNTIRVWDWPKLMTQDLYSGKGWPKDNSIVVHGHTSVVRCIVLASSASNSKQDLIISASEDKTIKIWHLVSGNLIRTLFGHTGFVRALVLSSDGKCIISGSNDSVFKMWRISTGDLMRTFARHGENQVTSLGITNKSNCIISGGRDNLIKITNVLSEPLQELEGNLTPITAICVARQSKFVAVASADATIELWQRAEKSMTYHRVSPLLEGHTKQITALAATQIEPVKIISACEAGAIKVWSLNEGINAELIRTFRCHEKGVSAIALCHSTQWIVSGGLQDTSVKVWELATGSLLCECSGHTGNGFIMSVAVTPDSGFIASGGKDSKVVVLKRVRGAGVKYNVYRTLSGHSTFVSAIAISNDATKIISGGFDHIIKIWDLSTGVLIRNVENHSGKVNAIKILRTKSDEFPDISDYIVTGSNDKTVMVVHLETGDLIRGYTTCKVNAIAVTDDGNYVLSGGSDGNVNVRSVLNPCLSELFDHDTLQMSIPIIKRKSYLFDESHDGERIMHTIIARDEVDMLKLILSNRPLVLFSELGSNNERCTLLRSAVEHSADRCVSTILDMYIELMNVSLNSDPMDIRQAQVFELINIKDLSLISKQPKYANMFLKFIASLHLIPVFRPDNRAIKASLLDDRMCCGSETRLGEGDDQVENYWEHALDVYSEGDPNVKHDSLPYVFPLKGVADLNSDFLQDLVNFAETENNFTIFNETIGIFVAYQWDIVVKGKFYFDCFWYICFCAGYMWNVIYLVRFYFKECTIFANCDPTNQRMKASALFIGCLYCCIFFTIHEIRQFRVQVRNRVVQVYFKSLWNWLDIMSLVTIWVSLSIEAYCLLFDIRDGVLQERFVFVGAISQILMGINSLFFLQGGDASGSLVRMVVKIFTSTVNFGIILLIFVVAFAGSFTVLFGSQVVPNSYSSYANSFLFFVNLLFGNSDFDSMTDALFPELALTLQLMFLISVPIILLNLLISLMSFRFGQVKDNERSESIYAKAIIILEYMELISESDKIVPIENQKKTFNIIEHAILANKVLLPIYRAFVRGLVRLRLIPKGDVDYHRRFPKYLQVLISNDNNDIPGLTEADNRDANEAATSTDISKLINASESNIRNIIKEEVKDAIDVKEDIEKLKEMVQYLLENNHK